jgi:hypothetical protein
VTSSFVTSPIVWPYMFVIMSACDLEAGTGLVPHPAGLVIERIYAASRSVRVVACASEAA